MRVRCVLNKGIDLRPYEYKPINNIEELGRFGVTGYGEFNQLDIGKEYLVMGIIVFETYQAYLIDDNGFVCTCPCLLFEIEDSKVSSNWCFRLVDKDENIYPFIQAIFGYPELCSDLKAYEKLIVDKDEDALRIYFRRKIELEEGIER